MPQSLEVHPEILTISGQQMSTMCDTLSTTLQTLQARLNQIGQPWKDGEYGSAFANGPNGYVDSSAELISSTQNMITTFTGFSTALLAAAKRFSDIESDNTNSFSTS
ncbi:MAG: hypothetical protein J2P17_01705 [Mycobacterium sp.]|nr:hypothetical protein [Mycobacterium sp.]